MPRIRRHLPGKYREKSPKALQPNFTRVKPLTIFPDENGKWGAKAGDGTVVIKPEYELLEQTEEDKIIKRFKMITQFEVIEVTPHDWDLLAFYSPD